MSAPLLIAAISLSQLLLALAGCFAGWRILRGPRAQDRVVALDTLYVTSMLLFLVTGMRTASSFFFEAAMVIGLLGFVGSFALAKFLLRGEVIE